MIWLREETPATLVRQRSVFVCSVNRECEGLLITAIVDAGGDSDAYILKDAMRRRLPVRITGEYGAAAVWRSGGLVAYIRDSAWKKAFFRGSIVCPAPAPGAMPVNQWKKRTGH